MSQADVHALPNNSPLAPPTDGFEKAVQGSSVPRGFTLFALAGLLLVVGFQLRGLWAEYQILRQEQDGARRNEVIGYPGVAPILSLARKPDNWFHEEGEQTYLWAGWRDGVGHVWFRCATGDIHQPRLSLPIGRDFVRAIDHPVVESSGGEIWARIHDGEPIAALNHGGVETAYPVLVLGKVGAVNDVVGQRPVLVTWNPTGPIERRVAAYESTVGGERVTMGLAGYFLGGQPVLYDRRTESLWTETDGDLVAVAGERKGERLRSVPRPRAIAWKRWKAENPAGRLVVGADRSRPIPEG